LLVKHLDGCWKLVLLVLVVARLVFENNARISFDIKAVRNMKVNFYW
jgi:hypothetical protein